MRDFLASLNGSDLVYCFNLRRKPSMDAKDFSFNQGGNAKVVKDLGAVLPRVGVSVFSDDFVVETIDRCDLS